MLLLALLLTLVVAGGLWFLWAARDRGGSQTVNSANQHEAAIKCQSAIRNELREIAENAKPVVPKIEPSPSNRGDLLLCITCPSAVPAEFRPEAYECINVNAQSQKAVDASNGTARIEYQSDQISGWPFVLAIQVKGQVAAFFLDAKTTFEKPGTYTLEIPMATGPWVYGTIVQGNGAAAAGVEVNFMRHRVSGGTVEVFSTGQCVTNSDGRFMLVRTGSARVHGPSISGAGVIEASLSGDGFTLIAAQPAVVVETGFQDLGTLTLGQGPSIEIQLVLDGQLYMRPFQVTLGHGLVLTLKGQGQGGSYRFDGVPSLAVSGPSAWYYIDVSSDPDGDGWENIVGRLIIKELPSARGPQIINLRDNAAKGPPPKD